jgi:integrase
VSGVRLPVGATGYVGCTKLPSGKVRARCRQRDWDGAYRQVQATGKDRRSAERTLRARLAARGASPPARAGGLTGDSTFARLVEYWLADLELEGRVLPQTVDSYASQMRRLVLPAFEHLTLREIGVARCDTLIKGLARESHSKARQAKNVLRLAFGLAVRHEVIPRNPVDGIARLRGPRRDPDVLTPDQVNRIRIAVRFWETGIVPTGPKPDGQLSAVIEVMLGTSARIGEALALRRCDVDWASEPPLVAIGGTIISPKGGPPFRQDHPKTAKSHRVVAVPPFTAEALRRRLAGLADTSPDALVFQSRNGTPITTNNLRRQLRRALDLAGLERVTPHMFRRTVATEVKEAATADLAAELLGHTDPRITIRHYIRRDRTVNPATAQILDRALKPDW